MGLMKGSGSNCLTDEQMRLAGTPFESFLMRYVFPFPFVLGVFGNLINLCVLLHPRMRSRSNILLAALAIADLLFLISMLPHSLASFDYFAFDRYFREFYFFTKTHSVAFANWFSAASIWIIIAICVDRVLEVRSQIPLLTYKWRHIKMTVFLSSIIVGTFLLTFYHHIQYDCIQYEYCNASQVFSICIPVTSTLWRKNDISPHSSFFRSFIHSAALINAALVVLVPNVVIAVLNAALIYELKRRNESLLLLEEKKSSSRIKKERRTTVTVCLIVTCFTLTQGPSAWLHIWFMINTSTRLFGAVNYNLSAATSCLVYIGKSLNFILFCLSSKSYRRRLKALLDHHFSCKSTQKTITESYGAKNNQEMISLQTN